MWDTACHKILTISITKNLTAGLHLAGFYEEPSSKPIILRPRIISRLRRPTRTLSFNGRPVKD